MVVWVIPGQLAGLLIVQVVNTLSGDEMDLDIDPLAVGVVPLVGVAGVTVHGSQRGWSTSLGEEIHHLVERLVVVSEVVPEHVSVLQVGLRVSLLGMDEVWELCRVSDEEDRGVVVHQVQVTLLGVELGGEASRISS